MTAAASPHSRSSPTAASASRADSCESTPALGSSTKSARKAPHAHWIADVSPDNRFALVADLGLDDVLVYKFDDVQGKLTPNSPPYAQVKAGSGPRHLAFAPNGKFAYLITEMASTVVAFSYNAEKGTLTTLQTLPNFPKDYNGLKEAAEITVHPNGKFVYASNRGSANSIAAYKIDGAKGTLTPVGIFPIGGKIPRHFTIDPTGKFLIAANADSNNLVTFTIDENTGALTPTGKEVSVPSPQCIAFAEHGVNLFTSHAQQRSSATTASSNQSRKMHRQGCRRRSSAVQSRLF